MILILNIKKVTFCPFYIILCYLIYHLLIDFGDLEINKFNHNMIQMYIINKINGDVQTGKKGLSEKTVKDIMVVLKSTLKYAMNENMIDYLPSLIIHAFIWVCKVFFNNLLIIYSRFAIGIWFLDNFHSQPFLNHFIII